MEFEEPEQQRGPPPPQRSRQGVPKEGAAYRPTAGHGKTQRAGSVSAPALMLRERGGAEGLLEGAVLREGSHVLRHR